MNKIAGYEISTHALTEGDGIGQAVHNTVNISTHALTEGDRFPLSGSGNQGISTHALTEGDGIRSPHSSNF